MRRVCCLVERWESGGIESFLYNILTRIDLTRMQVDIVASSLGGSIFTKPLQERGVRFLELSGSQQNVPENHRRFRALLNGRRYDVLHLNAFQGLSLACLPIARQEGVPRRIAHSHNTGLRKSLTRPLKLAVHGWARERYAADATDLWACSRAAAEFLFPKRELERRDFQFIPNGIDTGRFRFDPAVRRAVRAELGLADQFVIGNVGRLCYQKNQEFLLDVLADLLKRNPDSRLLLAGEGEDKPFLVRKAEGLHIADKVLFYGTTGHVERLLWAMDAFVFPSRFEGLGIAAIEAQAAGLPVVCSEHIPPEVHITPNIRSLTLRAGAAAWSEALERTVPVRERESLPEAVRCAGFHIADQSRRLEMIYSGVEGGGST